MQNRPRHSKVGPRRLDRRFRHFAAELEVASTRVAREFLDSATEEKR